MTRWPALASGLAFVILGGLGGAAITAATACLTAILGDEGSHLVAIELLGIPSPAASQRAQLSQYSGRQRAVHLGFLLLRGLLRVSVSGRGGQSPSAAGRGPWGGGAGGLWRSAARRRLPRAAR